MALPPQSVRNHGKVDNTGEDFARKKPLQIDKTQCFGVLSLSSALSWS